MSCGTFMTKRPTQTGFMWVVKSAIICFSLDVGPHAVNETMSRALSACRQNTFMPLPWPWLRSSVAHTTRRDVLSYGDTPAHARYMECQVAVGWRHHHYDRLLPVDEAGLGTSVLFVS